MYYRFRSRLLMPRINRGPMRQRCGVQIVLALLSLPAMALLLVAMARVEASFDADPLKTRVKPTAH